MYKFQTAFKSGVLTLFVAAIVSLFGLPSADAASYTYNLTYGVSGSITTNCDNCVLNASNITAWNMTAPGLFSIASTVPGAQVSVPAGDTEMVATPQGIVFSFGGTVDGSFGPIVFSNPSGNIGFVAEPNPPISIGSNFGSVYACGSTAGCMFLAGDSGNVAIASVSVPFVGAVSYNFTGKVTSATGIYATAGATVSGTFTFDLNAGDGALPFSLTTPWSSASTGTTRVVASTLTSGSLTFSDAGSTSNKATVAGLATTGSSAPNEYFASDTEFSSATKSAQHSFQIVGGTGANAPFNSNGLPLFQNATGTGTLLATTGNATVGQLTYSITSLTAAPTTLSVSPATLNFPNTLVNTQSAPLTVSITNTSPNDVSIGGPLNFDNTNFQITADSCAPVLHAKASCTLSLIFAPTQRGGLDQTQLNIADDAQGSPQGVSLVGTATILPAPLATLTTQSLTFPGQQVGTTSVEQFVTIKNTGNLPLTFFSIAIAPGFSGNQTDAFTLLNHCVPTLAPGRACTVFVSFKAVVAGAVSARLVISDNAATDSEASITDSVGQVVELQGYGTTVPVPGLTMDAGSLDFADQVTGTASVKKFINLTNTGTAPLQISSVALAGSQASDFILQNACVPSLPAGHHCTVFVTFKPTTAGKLSSAVVINSNAGGAVSVPLYGTATAATAPVLTLSTTYLDFGSQQDGTTSARRYIDLTNTGTAPLSLSSIAVVGSEGTQAYFTLRNDCVPVLLPGRLCALFITFSPMSAKTGVEALLVITDNAQVSQQTVQLAGTGY